MLTALAVMALAPSDARKVAVLANVLKRGESSQNCVCAFEIHADLASTFRAD